MAFLSHPFLFASFVASLWGVAGFCSAATVDDFVGQPVEATFILDGIAWETTGGHVDGLGSLALSTPAGALALVVQTATPEQVEWVVSYGAGGSSDVATVSWNGHGWMGDFTLSNGWIVRLGEPGAVAPGEQRAENAVVPILVAFGVGCLLFQVFISSWRERSVHL